ncbi:pseudouridine synthase [Lipomyces arxii]|uniref:pseudouridine synthase n=1 Tax=Lipomyces arxii TaxID=56418 RepID=UPI0034CDB8C2
MSGIFAVEKPPGVSSNAFKEKVQIMMEQDPVFHQKLDRDAERKRKRRKLPKVKMGHGGTLDPAADGVLVLGVNDGTKRLGEFLGCTKTYDVIAHFGCATTTYDAEGAVLQTAGCDGVTDEGIEKVLPLFTGEIQQIPPIYSAIKVGGTKLYEYARNLESLPRDIQPRNMTISELTVGELIHEHEYIYPSKRASSDEILQERVFRQAALKALAKDGNKAAEAELESLKDKGDLATLGAEDVEFVIDSSKAPPGPEIAETDVKGPIVHIRATVSSGTYIRSLVHDMAIAMGTNAYVVKLTRSRQGDWEIGKNVISNEDLQGDFDRWIPQAKFWMENGPEAKYDPEVAIETESAKLEVAAIEPDGEENVEDVKSS